MSNNSKSASEREAALFGLAIERPLAGRAAFLEAVCGSDKALRGRLEALLAAHDQSYELLGNDTLRVAAEATRKVEVASEPIDEAIGQKLGPFKLLERVG